MAGERGVSATRPRSHAKVRSERTLGMHSYGERYARDVDDLKHDWPSERSVAYGRVAT